MQDNHGILSKDERLSQARAFLASVQWKLISSNSSTAKTGELPKFRMRVFAKGCPRHALREVHELLAADNPVENVLVDGVVQQLIEQVHQVLRRVLVRRNLEPETLRVVLHEIASVNPAHRGIEWAKSYASDGLKGAGSELYARWLETFKDF